MGLVTAEFLDFAKELLRQQSAEGLPLVLVGHPVGGISREKAKALITDDVLQKVIQALTGGKET